jgi:4-amino-4-deoxy-L-arabinose transferase-like glycosyltransferase
MTIALGHIAWGALFAAVFGPSFTVLAASTLVMSAACILIFYLLLRHLDVAPAYALLGAALLGFNPISVFLGYSFMTDMTFLAFVLAACLCYVRGLQGYAEGWLWLGGIAASLAYLTRQFGIILVPAVLGYLLWSRGWTWRRAAAAGALPLLVVVAYTAWAQTQPTQLIALDMERVAALAANRTLEFALDRAQRLDWMMTALGLSLMPLLVRPRRPLLALPLFCLLVVLQVRSAQAYGSLFPPSGNIVDHTGYVMGYYDAAPIWSRWVWIGLGITGTLLVSLALTSYGEQVWSWLRSRPWRERAADPAFLLYLLALGMVAVLVLLPPFLFDRYLLPIIAALMLPALRRMSAASTGNTPRLSWLLVLPLALFALVAQRDYLAHAAARWQAAEQLAAEGIPHGQIDAGFEWAGWYLYDEGARRIRQTGDLTYIYFPAYAALDPVYVVSDLPREGYTQVGLSSPYQSWLDGGQVRRVLVLKRQ